MSLILLVFHFEIWGKDFNNNFIDMDYFQSKNVNVILSKEIVKKVQNKIRRSFPEIHDIDGLDDSF